MIWYNNTFEGHWPVGTSAIVRAKTAEEAAEFLTDELVLNGLQQTVLPSDMVPFSKEEKVIILQDGEY